MRLRSLLCGVVLVGIAGQAYAADLSETFLRGSQTVINASGPMRWDGVYFGGQGGMSVSGADFTNTDPEVSSLLARSLPVRGSNVSSLGKRDATGSHFGGFIGYNVQWDDAVLSLEANYSHVDQTITSTNILAGSAIAPDGNIYPFAGNGSATLHLTDLADFRVRAGWAAGNFMPYGFIGVAMVRADVSRSIAVSFIPPVGAPTFAAVTNTEQVKDRFGYGYTAGLGLDYAVMSNLFVRAEYQYANFDNFESLNAHIHNVRLGAAFKF